MDYILANGDSWTGGLYMGTQDKLWPKIIEKTYNIKVTNLAIGGASNRRIFRTTFDYLYNAVDLPKCLIIGWTSLLRTEFHHVSGNYLRLTPIGVPIFDDHQIVKNYENIKKIYYEELHSEHLNYKEFVSNFYMLQEFCHYKNIKLLNFCSFESLSKLQDETKLSNSSWIIPPTTTTKDFLENDFEMTSSGHTNELGQIHWANIVYNEYTKIIHEQTN